MDYTKQLSLLAKERGGIIETRIAEKHGISKAVLSNLCRDGKIHRIVRGQYVMPNELTDELLSLSRRSDSIVFSHETALFLHGISDRTPFVHTVTAMSGHIPSASILSDFKIYYIKPSLFELGKSDVFTPMGNKVSCYDFDRTICDIIRSRSRIGTETFLAALKMYAASPKKDLNKLALYAGKLRVSKVVYHYLEVLI